MSMKLSRIYCRTSGGEDRVYLRFQNSEEELFLRHNPRLNNLIKLLQILNLNPAELFKAYEEKKAISNERRYTPSLTSQDMLSAFSRLMERKKISRSELARRMGVEKSYLTSLFCQRYSTNLTMYTIKRISDSLEVPLSQIFSMAQEIKDGIS